MKQAMRPRPFWITIIAIILFASGIIGLAVNILYMLEFTSFLSNPINLLIYVTELVFSILYIILAYGLMNMEEYARKWGVIIPIASVIFRALVLSFELTLGKPILEVIFNAYIIIYIAVAIYLHSGKTRKAFIS